MGEREKEGKGEMGDRGSHEVRGKKETRER